MNLVVLTESFDSGSLITNKIALGMEGFLWVILLSSTCFIQYNCASSKPNMTDIEGLQCRIFIYLLF